MIFQDVTWVYLGVGIGLLCLVGLLVARHFVLTTGTVEINTGRHLRLSRPS